jgi:hypothetical protein
MKRVNNNGQYEASVGAGSAAMTIWGLQLSALLGKADRTVFEAFRMSCLFRFSRSGFLSMLPSSLFCFSLIYTALNRLLV